MYIDITERQHTKLWWYTRTEEEETWILIRMFLYRS